MITDKKEKGDTKKLTKKDITVTKTDVIVDEPKTDITAVNSFAILKKLIAKLPENIVENKSLYYFAVNIIENNLIESDIVKLFGKAE